MSVIIHLAIAALLIVGLVADPTGDVFGPWGILGAFFAGFYILVKGAGFLIDGSSSLARRFHISNIVIGLVIVGIGTSIPEFSISFIANLSGEGAIGLGTIIGSNTFNILFVLGLSALIFPLRLKKIWVDRDLIWNVIAVLAASAIALAFGRGVISRPEGALMIAIFVLWLFVIIRHSNEVHEGEEPFRVLTLPLIAGFIMAGFVGVIVGGEWVVRGAVFMAREIGMSEALIGLTIVGIGTSFPELVVTLRAAFRREPGIAIGNIIGSNIFDFLAILGVGAFVRPIAFPFGFSVDIAITILSTVILYGFMFIGEYYVLKRWQGFVMVGLYLLYFGHIMSRV